METEVEKQSEAITSTIPEPIPAEVSVEVPAPISRGPKPECACLLASRDLVVDVAVEAEVNSAAEAAGVECVEVATDPSLNLIKKFLKSPVSRA